MPEASAKAVHQYFDSEVPLDGYRWWYCDVVSDDHQYCLVVIGFIGSVFSPYYAAARRRGTTDPTQHCSINAILYGPRKKSWAMTERGHRHLHIDQQGLTVGPSSMRWDNDSLVLSIDERCNPWPSRWRGEVRLTPTVTTAKPFQLHSNARHSWWPYAPVTSASVALESPNLQFTGSGYIDTNFGSEPLERAFRGWHWTRRESAPHDGKTPAITYHTIELDGQERDLTLALTDDGLTEATTPGSMSVSPGLWRVKRQLRSAHPIETTRTLEDTPFYVRSLLTASERETPYRLMHESLDLKRFSSRWVQTLLPFRMPRRS
ncbi:MAG: carotenoid 1,2-hydratase [Pseudomonadota bacterium]